MRDSQCFTAALRVADVVVEPGPLSIHALDDDHRRIVSLLHLHITEVADGLVVGPPIRGRRVRRCAAWPGRPSLTEERRKDLAKKAHHMAEEARVEVRRYRHEGNDRIKKMFKDKAISEDDERRGLEESQKLTDRKIKEVDDLLKSKEQEILAV